MKGGSLEQARVCAISEASLHRAAELVKAGQLIVVPTDTVYGLACDPFNPQAINRLFEVKRRPRAKSIQVLLPNLGNLNKLGLTLPQPLGILSAAFLPGGFSPICVASENSPLATIRHEIKDDGTQKLTQAIRVPNSAPLHTILAELGPLAATSANISGQESATSAQQAYEALGNDVGIYLDAGTTPGPVSSTVVSAEPTQPYGIAILREGVIPSSRITAELAKAGGQA